MSINNKSLLEVRTDIEEVNNLCEINNYNNFSDKDDTNNNLIT